MQLAKKLWREYRGPLTFILLMCCFRSAWADWVTVPTGSMNPTIIEGDRVLVDKHTFGLRVPFTLIHLTAGADPARGDIVVFDSPQDGTSLVKRVVGVPGDTVELDGERLLVNGRPASYSAGDPKALGNLLAETAALHPTVLREQGLGADHDILLLPSRAGLAPFGPTTVPPGMYVVLGDNRDNSADSRVFGFVPRRNIVGRATRVVMSFNPERHYLPRGNRFLVPLE
ncbi:MAG TPA: signal peptidase I [Steroidobacteraceae bacterium]|jgi:signal peptidase I|nr:signal peptidase I [Steroidobacteraceae bacterium]